MSHISADQITMPRNSDHQQSLPSFEALPISDTGGSRRISTRKDLYTMLSIVPLPLESYRPVVIPEDFIIWQYAIHYTNRPVQSRGEAEIRVPPRNDGLYMKDHLLAVRRARKLRVYMRTRIVAMLSSTFDQYHYEESHMVAARGCIAYLDRSLARLSQTENTYLDAWSANSGPGFHEWDDMCDAVDVFDEGWLKLAGVPLDFTLRAEQLRRVAFRAMSN